MHDNDRKGLVEEIKALMKNGLTLDDACHKTKVPKSTYAYWMRKFREEAYPERTDEEVLKACDEVDALRLKGDKLNDACEKVKISRNVYYEVRNKDRSLAVTSLSEPPKRRAPLPMLHTFNFNTMIQQGAQPDEPQASDAPMVLLIGREASVNQALATLAQMWSR